VVNVIGGPVSQDGFNWWQIEPPSQTSCWAAGNWLYPLTAESTPTAPFPPPTPAPPTPVTPIAGIWCTGGLNARDLGGGTVLDQNYVVDFEEPFGPGDDARIYFSAG
jgi:hypothetical protein